MIETAQPNNSTVTPTSAGISNQPPPSTSIALYNSAGICHHRITHPSFHRLLYGPPLPILDPDLLGFLCYDLMSNNHHGLVFCPTKAACVYSAKIIANVLSKIPVILPENDREKKMEWVRKQSSMQEKRQKLIEKLGANAFGVNPDLAFTVRHGVAFHNSSLSLAERDTIECAYRDRTNGCISVICATTTLACGINIGAQRVIFISLQTGRVQMTPAMYKQCAGRAGRAGVDQRGESIILKSIQFRGNNANKQQRLNHMRASQNIMTASFTPLTSCLDAEPMSDRPSNVSSANPIKSETATDIVQPSVYYPNLCRLLLDAICSKLVRCHSELLHLASMTLLYHQKVRKIFESQTGGTDAQQQQVRRQVEMMVDSSLQWLVQNDFISQVNNLDALHSTVAPYEVPPFLLQPTLLGSATVASALPPTEALTLHRHLTLVRKQLILEGGLHLLFLCTPLKLNFQIKWERYHDVNYQTNAHYQYLLVCFFVVARCLSLIPHHFLTDFFL